mgnify:CR=1 FL=1
MGGLLCCTHPCSPACCSRQQEHVTHAATLTASLSLAGHLWLAERALLALSALLGEGEGDAASGAAAAETIAGLGGLATLQGLHAVLHRAAQAEAEEGSYAADVAAMALRVHGRVAAGGTARDEL